MESDKKLDKLENFLGRLNSKGVFLFNHEIVNALGICLQ